MTIKFANTDLWFQTKNRSIWDIELPRKMCCEMCQILKIKCNLSFNVIVLVI